MVQDFGDWKNTLRYNSAAKQLGLGSLFEDANQPLHDPVLLTVGEGRHGEVADRMFVLSHKHVSVSENFISFRDTSGKVDLARINEWMRFCARNHGGLCAESAALISNLKVIDCKARRVVDLPSSGTAYVTFSYVWGPAQVSDGVVGGTLQNVPAVIEDAIYITTQLNFRYLWIDRYCISNSDAGERHRLIQAMGSVYQNSELTIIAAAVDGPNFALPGVRSGSRGEPPFHIGQYTLTPFNLMVKKEVNESKWASRGWTYQEALLARRRLIFTKTQMYFQCKTMHCLEGIEVSPETMHTKDLDEMVINRLLQALPDHSVGRNADDIIQRIQEFCARTLSYDSNALHAFQGIFRQFEDREKLVENLWGVPILPIECLVKQHYAEPDPLVFGLL